MVCNDAALEQLFPGVLGLDILHFLIPGAQLSALEAIRRSDTRPWKAAWTMVRGSVDARAVLVYSRAAIDRALRQLLVKLACRLALCRPRLGLIRYSPLKQMTTRNVALIHRPVERKSPSFDACLTRRRPKLSESLGAPRLASAVRNRFTRGHQHPKGDDK